MKNLKKILALALVFAFTLTLFAGAAFTDAAEIGDDYKDDVSMLVELKILGGYPDGSFKPEGNITRAEFCKMVYSLMYGSDSDGSLFATQASSFTDVEGNANISWAKGYINYCANQNIVGGVGGGKFNPSGNITVAEVSKMLLVLLGCDPAKEGFGGPNWAGNVVSKAMALGVFNGWVGNSAEAATRQLVAKLMKNTIFAPVYRYNAFTGMGSQYNMDQEENETLGESVMDMNHVSGIVVANENFAIDRDEEGEFIDTPLSREDTSYVYYLTEDDEGAFLRIEEDLDDTLLGCLVDVYFTANGSDGNYSKVELIGNVLLNADTKAYDVDSADIELFPNEESKGQRAIAPYITFTADGIERTIKSPDKTLEVSPSMPYDGEVFRDMSYVCNDTVNGVNSSTLTKPLANDPFFTKMGSNSVAKYRVISVDGGNKYSYIFKFHNNSNAIKIGVVSSYNEARNTITVSGIGSQDLEDVILHGDIAQDDYVVAYRLNGKINLEKVEIITGAATNIVGDEKVTINGNDYGIDFDIFTNAGVTSISDYYENNTGARNEGTKYFVYKNMILDIDAASTVSSAGNYALVLNSTYDAGLDAAYVKLAFSDNTEGTYQVSKFWQPDRSNLSNTDNDLPSRFANNAKFMWIYQYSITSDGKVNLGIAAGEEKKDGEGYAVSGDTFKTGDGTFYASAQTVVFFVYGEMKYKKVEVKEDHDDNEETPEIVISTSYEPEEGNLPIKAKAYKLSEFENRSVTLGDFVSKAIWMPEPGVVVSNEGNDNEKYGNFVQDKQGSLRSMVVGAMTYGKTAPSLISLTDSAAYVADIKKVYNVNTNDSYIEAKLINEDGLQTLKSIDSYDDPAGDIGIALDEIAKANNGTYKDGTIVRYKVNEEGMITSIKNEYGTEADMQAYDEEKDSGFYYVTIVSQGNGLVGFFPYSTVEETVETSTGRLKATTDARTFSDKYVGVITIRDYAEYAGDYLVTHSRSENIPAGGYNAIIQLDAGKILRIFSFEE